MRWRSVLALVLAMSVVGTAAAGQGKPPEIRVETLPSVPYELAREALEEAIASEGLVAPVISHFGDMLARTAADLGHRADLYREAHIYTFCSVSAAAQLASENPALIALCPLSIAIYQLPEEDGVKLAYRPTGLQSMGGEMARDTQARIVRHTRTILGLE